MTLGGGVGLGLGSSGEVTTGRRRETWKVGLTRLTTLKGPTKRSASFRFSTFNGSSLEASHTICPSRKVGLVAYDGWPAAGKLGKPEAGPFSTSDSTAAQTSRLRGHQHHLPAPGREDSQTGIQRVTYLWLQISRY